MRKRLGVGVLLLIVFSCDDHRDYFEQLDNVPTFELNSSTTQHGSYLRDSVKLNHLFLVNYKLVSSSPVTFSYAKSDHFSLIIDQQKVQIKGLMESDNLILIKAEDKYQKSCCDSIYLTVFDNLPPVAILNYDVTQLDDSYTLTLDGSSSFDRDQKYGGYLLSYSFSVNGESYISGNPILKYSVIKGNTYTIHFRVQDDNNAWSNEIVTYIQI